MDRELLNKVRAARDVYWQAWQAERYGLITSEEKSAYWQRYLVARDAYNATV